MKLAVLLALAASGAVFDARRELSVGGIRLGQSEAYVLSALGKPESRSTSETTDYLPVALEYPGFFIELDEQGVGRLLASSSRYCTPVGACPGMRLSDVQRIYGSAMKVEQIDGVPTGFVFNDGCWLAFSTRAEDVLTIEIACVP